MALYQAGLVRDRLRAAHAELAAESAVELVPIRTTGDRVQTRQLAAGEVDALVLALCGLERLGKTALALEILPPERMLPAVGQGALAIECRSGDGELRQLLAPLNDPASAACVAAERAMLAALDGSCRTPIAGLATIAGDRLTLDALLLTPDGNAERRGRHQGMIGDAVALGRKLGEELRRGAGSEFGFG